MQTDTLENIYSYILEHAPVTVKELSAYFDVGNVMIHRHLRKLLEWGRIEKTGTPPKVHYFPSKKIQDTNISSLLPEFIEDTFLSFEPDGSMLEWRNGFARWCETRNMNPLSEADIYEKTIRKYQEFHDLDGFIDGMQKLRDSLSEVYLDKCFYLDFYSIEKYGKTKLGTLLFHAKQSQDRKLLTLIEPLIENPITLLIKRENITSYAFIPPSIDRKVQLLKELEKDIALKLPRLDLKKIWRGTPIPQKSLSSMNDRIKNARDTIFVENKDFITDTILLIDDALGSGATLNETAKKLKDGGIARKVIGLALVGSFKGFDIIREI